MDFVKYLLTKQIYGKSAKKVNCVKKVKETVTDKFSPTTFKEVIVKTLDDHKCNQLSKNKAQYALMTKKLPF